MSAAPARVGAGRTSESGFRRDGADFKQCGIPSRRHPSLANSRVSLHAFAVSRPIAPANPRPVVRPRGDGRQHDRRRHSAHAGRHRRAAAERRGCSSASGSSARSTRCSAPTRSPSWARCCRAAAVSTSLRATRSATTPGFFVGWMDWISTCASIAGDLDRDRRIGRARSSSLSGGARGADRDGESSSSSRCCCLRGAQARRLAQQITSLAKAVALLALVVACFVFAGPTPTLPAAAPPRSRRRPSMFAAFLLAAQSVIYAYDGWTGPIYFSEELDDPGAPDSALDVLRAAERRASSIC